jgi:hypothetical protein
MWRKRVLVGWAAVAISLGWLAAVGAGQATETTVQRILATDTAALRKQVGQEATVVGQIARTGQSKGGMQFLNFADSEFTAVCHAEDVAEFRKGEPVEAYRGQAVEITGTVELYRGKLQIRLREPSQINVQAEPQRAETTPAPADSASPAEFALRQIGEDVWLSPAGLRYQGRDPAGLSRVEHISRHVADIPSRDGPHGVFDGGRDKAFAVIDEAWKLAHSRRLRPVAEGERSSYTVDMGRRIGFLGGRAGAAQKHPPLSHVFIVFETGTTNIITAFPK